MCHYVIILIIFVVSAIIYIKNFITSTVYSKTVVFEIYVYVHFDINYVKINAVNEDLFHKIFQLRKLLVLKKSTQFIFSQNQ